MKRNILNQDNNVRGERGWFPNKHLTPSFPGGAGVRVIFLREQLHFKINVSISEFTHEGCNL